MRIYWIDKYNGGKLGMMARPRGGDWLEDEIYKLKNYQVSTIISFLEKEENAELQLIDEKQICNNLGIEFISLPIKDRKTPESFHRIVETVKQKLTLQNNIIIHCRMGIGRTALFSAATLIDQFDLVEDIFDLLSEIRTMAVPDTQEQINWVKSYKDKM